jgi:hypothetical protein
LRRDPTHQPFHCYSPLVVATPYRLFTMYALAVIALNGTAFMLCYRRFRDEMTKDRRFWYRPILRSSPAVVKVAALVGVLCSIAWVYYLAGGRTPVSDWTEAEPQQRAALWIGVGLFNYFSLLAAAALVAAPRRDQA